LIIQTATAYNLESKFKGLIANSIEHNQHNKANLPPSRRTDNVVQWNHRKKGEFVIRSQNIVFKWLFKLTSYQMPFKPVAMQF